MHEADTLHGYRASGRASSLYFFFFFIPFSLVPNLDRGEGVEIIDSVGIWLDFFVEAHCKSLLGKPPWACYGRSL